MRLAHAGQTTSAHAMMTLGGSRKRFFFLTEEINMRSQDAFVNLPCFVKAEFQMADHVMTYIANTLVYQNVDESNARNNNIGHRPEICENEGGGRKCKYLTRIGTLRRSWGRFRKKRK